MERHFRDGHSETWWAADLKLATYAPGGYFRLVVATTDPGTLPAASTWYLLTNLPHPTLTLRASATVPPADLAEVVGLYGLRQWVEQGYRQVKGALGWAHFQVRADRAIRRHWQLVWCAFSFWLVGRPAPGHASRDVSSEHTGASGADVGGKMWAPAATPTQRPTLSWPVALRAVHAWRDPWTMLWRYWRAWSTAPPPAALQALLDAVALGRPLHLYLRI